MLNCPQCNGQQIVKNGHIHNGKQRFKCQDCGRQFIENPTKIVISDEKKAWIDRLLLERIALAGIARVAQVSEKWLQDYVNARYAEVPRQVHISAKKKHKLTLQADEMWSFVDHKGNKQWLWLAIDENTREIAGVQIGQRDREAAKQLWASLPAVYRQCAVVYTDFWEAYKKVIPSKRHRAVGKETGQTNSIERFNCTVRQRVSRLVRKALSFSKKLENHIGAIWMFVHHYNASLQASLLV
ncbi:MAG: IS1 family transposase [Leptolyngbyaceae cyanobacterium]